jgi:hypothetical protein
MAFERSRRGLQLWFRPRRDPTLQSGVMVVQSSGSPAGTISRLHFGSPGNLCHSDVASATSRIEYYMCRNPSFGLVTKAKGITRVRAKGSLGVKPKGSPGVKPKGCPGVKARGSPGVTSHTPGSVRKCEGVSPHTPKATPTLGDGVPVDSQNFRERLQWSNLNVLWRSLYHWKALEA